MEQTLFSLPIQKQLSSSISLRQLDEQPVLVIEHPHFRAAVALQGAHLLFWQPQGNDPVIWLSKKSFFKTGVAIRGGVPICWPWFGKVAEPAHGFSRNMIWDLVQHQETNEQVSLSLELKDSEESRKIWPHSFSLKFDLILNQDCHIKLTSKGNYQATSALHTYFQIGDIEKISVSGLGENYHDSLSGKECLDNAESLTFPGETNRIYKNPEAISVIDDPLLNRKIEVHHYHHSDVVAWNPAAATTATLTDMTADGYKTMVCIETARINKPIIVNDTQDACLETIIKVRPRR